VSTTPDLLVAADDRTGALEVGGVCADAGWGPVDVAVGLGGTGTSRIRVVDLATRHLGPDAAAEQVRAVADEPSRRVAHKIDSTLRGNWAHELTARLERAATRVLLVPAFPAVGRTCTAGVVDEHGRPVGESPAGRDARSPVGSSRPSEHLRLAGAMSVAEVSLGGGLSEWIITGDGIAVCDAATDADLAAIGRIWAGVADQNIVFAGTAGSIGAAACALVGLAGLVGVNGVEPAAPGRLEGGLTSPVRPLPLPALVVCGSLHPAARVQVAELVARGAVVIELDDEDGGRDPGVVVGPRWPSSADVVVLVSKPPTSLPVGSDEAEVMATRLGECARELVAGGVVATIVVVGGDTAAAVLGNTTMSVGGTVAAGMPWCRSAAVDGVLVVTKSGGFGSRRTLTDLLLERTPG
jgi:uncharacterized protein YgbK (DUF1537 family)